MMIKVLMWMSFLDLAKAFDKVRHVRLMNNVRAYGVD